MNRLERYAEYLLGSHWRELKTSLYRKRGRKCEACFSRDRIQGHHLIYREPLESCTEEDVMLLCPTCHGAVHKDTSLDALIKSDSIYGPATRRRFVLSCLTRYYGGEHRLNKLKMDRERAVYEQRDQLDRRQPLREIRRPKRWRDYSPDLIPEKKPWTV